MSEPDGADEFREVVRGILESTPAAAVPARLREQGYADFLGHDAHAAIAVLFREIGQSDASPPVLDAISLFALGRQADEVPLVGYPGFRDHDSLPLAEQTRAGVELTCLAFEGPAGANRMLAPARLAGQSVLVDVPCSAVMWVKSGAFAPDLHLMQARVTAQYSEVAALPDECWQGYLALTKVALAYQLLGLAERMSSLTVTHVNTRRQFGRPLAAHQAVRHRLADVTVAIAAARSVLAAADVTNPLLGRAGKALSGRAARLAGTQALQLHGAIGFSEEYVLHRLVRRAHVLDSLLGSAAWHSHQIGRQMLATARVPALIEL